MLKIDSPRPTFASRAWPFILRPVAAFLILVMVGSQSHAYSVLTHEEIIDLLWNDQLKPLLLARYPSLTGDQLREAHAAHQRTRADRR